MLEKLRQKLLEFIYSDKDAPLLAGFSVGFYVLLFYYSRNFGLANSFVQLLFFTVYYVIIPVIVLFLGYKMLHWLKLDKFRKNFLFVGILVFFAYYFIEINMFHYPRKILLGVMILSSLLSFSLKRYYKLFIILLFIMSLFNIQPLLNKALINKDSEWEKQPDNIEQAIFKKRPNIYYIQPDGYTNFTNLKDNNHNFDNSNFEAFLDEKGFTVYEKQHSNYYSTLLSNSSMFSMKHHYIANDIVNYRAREVIVGNNAVLRTLKHNKYKTFFITERPYLIMNRPDMGYDYCNIPYKDMLFLKDGWSLEYDVFGDLKKQMSSIEEKSGNFIFIEKFTPGHIVNQTNKFVDAKKMVISEKERYLESVKKANAWLREVISYIESKDPEALIIIGADHGGFVGFPSTSEAEKKTGDKLLINSVFGTLLAVKWNNIQHTEYDHKLKSSVNIFRTVFSYLSQDKKYLDNLQDNSSYIYLKEPKGLYRYINNKGEVVFEKADHVQD